MPNSVLFRLSSILFSSCAVMTEIFHFFFCSCAVKTEVLDLLVDKEPFLVKNNHSNGPLRLNQFHSWIRSTNDCLMKTCYFYHSYFRLARRIFWIGIANFILSPFIFIWVILYSFFTYAEVRYRNYLKCRFVKFEPTN